MHKLLKQAFTLIELLVVIAIIGILSGLIIVGMNGMTQKATIAKAQVFSNSLKNSLMTSLVGEWRMEGNANDTWSSIACSLNGTTSASSCINNNCLDFDGNDDYANCGTVSSLAPTNYLTVSFWVNFNSLTGNQYIISRGRDSYGSGYNVLKYGTQLIAFEVNLDDVDDAPEIDISGTTVISANRWYNVAATYDYSVGAKLYIDGKIEATSSLTGPVVYRSGQGDNFLIGVMSMSFPQWFDMNAKLDEIRFFNAAIPTSQIEEQYYGGLNNLLTDGLITQEEYQYKIKELVTAKK